MEGDESCCFAAPRRAGDAEKFSFKIAILSLFPRFFFVFIAS